MHSERQQSAVAGDQIIDAAKQCDGGPGVPSQLIPQGIRVDSREQNAAAGKHASYGETDAGSPVRVTLGGEELPLTATEYKLLITLVERRGRVQTRPQLLESVWDAQPDIQTRTVDMHVQRLRAKLGEVGDLIETVRGFGYRFRGGVK